MRTYFKPFTLVPLAFVVALTMMMAGCAEENPLETAEVPSQDLEAPQGAEHDDLDLFVLDDAVVEGRQIRNIDIEGVDEETEEALAFTGRIVNLQLERVDDNTVEASGRLIGQLNGERINDTFEGIELDVFDELGNLLDGNGNGVCPILFLELGPIFLDVLGLVVEVPDPIVVEIRAEEGPGNLLGNLLCALVGILD